MKVKEGGDFIAEGGFTCVYSPPLTCRGQADLPAGKYVSRVVNDPSEIETQNAVKAILARAEAEHPGKVAKYFNLMVSACDEFTIKPTDIYPNKHGEICTNHPKLQTPGEIKKGDGLYNIITPRQSGTFKTYTKDYKFVLSRSQSETARALKPLLKALVYVRGEFIHNDAHFSNVGWMMDGRLVLFDWGLTIVDNPSQKFEERIAKFLEIYKRDVEAGETYIDYRMLAVATGSQDPERLRVVWDILDILGFMKGLVVPKKITERARDKIIELLKVGIPSEKDLLQIIDEVFQEPIKGGTRRHKLRGKTTRKRFL